jgi:MOSC domain-containing protein YiiM
MESVDGQLVSVNVSGIQVVAHAGRDVPTGIFKRPVAGRVRVAGVNIAGDDQADRRVHGGPDRAAYAYAAEDLEWWAGQVGRALPPDAMGENLTVRGLDVTAAVIGERWRIGSTLFETTSPRVACFKLGIRMGEARVPQRFTAARRPGAYLRIVQEGDIGAGDQVEVLDRPDHGVTVGLVADAYHHDHSLAARLLEAPALAEGWRSWALQHVAQRPHEVVLDVTRATSHGSQSPLEATGSP